MGSFDWSLYCYLLPMSFVVLALVAVSIKWLPILCEEHTHRIKQEIILLCLIVIVGILIIYFNFFDGSLYYAYHDVGSDTYNQYVPYYLNLIKYIKNGTLGYWVNNYDLGISVFMNQAWAFDPFNIILVPLTIVIGEQYLSYLLVFVQAIRIILCAILFDHVLIYYVNKPISRIVASSLFSFNGFIILWGQHYWFATSCVMISLVILQIERIINLTNIKTFIGLSISVSITLLWSLYCGFMVLLACLIYGLIRCFYIKYINNYNNKRMILLITIIFASVAIGISISCITLIPSSYQIICESGRVDGSSSSFLERLFNAISFYQDPERSIISLKRLMGNALYHNNYIGSYYETVQIGASACIYIIIFQFISWYTHHANKHIKYVARTVIILFILYLFNGLLPLMFNGCTGIAYRSSFILVVPLCIMISIVFDMVILDNKVSIIAILPSIFITSFIIFYQTDNISSALYEKRVFFVSVIIVSFMLFMYQNKYNNINIIAFICVILIGTSIYDAFVTVNYRTASIAENFPSSSAQIDRETRSALAYIQKIDNKLYRIEKTYSDWTIWGDPLIQHYPSVSAYNSTSYEGVVKFFSKLWPGVALNDEVMLKSYRCFAQSPDNSAAATFLGVKYILSHDPLNNAWCDEIARFGDVTVYRNMLMDSLASTYTTFVTETQASHTHLVDAMGVFDTVIVPDDASAMLCASGIVPYANGDDTKEVIPSPNTATFSSVTNGVVEGTVNAAANEIICLPIPNVDGWEVAIDGTPVETLSVNYGFIGMVVPMGTHAVRATYAPPGLVEGCIVSIVGVLALTTLCLGALLWQKKQISLDWLSWV